MTIYKSLRLRKITVVILTLLLIIIGILLMFATGELTITMLISMFLKLIGVFLFIGGFVILKELLEYKR